MENDLQHEDLLIKLRAKLNEEKIKLWEPPYVTADRSVNQALKDLSTKYSVDLSIDNDTVLAALHELQLHSLDRSKENAEFKETGCATFRVKANMPGERPRMMKVVKKLSVMGSELIAAIADDLGVEQIKVKLIYNGKVLKPTPSLEEQGLKNGVQILALIMNETPEEIKEEDKMYLEMKKTRDDAVLLSECADDLNGEEQYMKLEDQSGNTVQLPASERRALMVGLALHERGRALLKNKEYNMALVLLLEADRLFSECRSSVLSRVDNVGILQLDIAWCYLLLHAAPPDATRRLANAQEAFNRTYGENAERLIALKGNGACERVLYMRLYLLQGILAYHQNKRDEARTLLDKAEREINALRVDSASVSALAELGWSVGAARVGLRAAGGDPHAAHDYLHARDEQRRARREQHRLERELGWCEDGSPVSSQLVDAVVSMGHTRGQAIRALRLGNNSVAEAVRIIQEQPDLVQGDDDSSSEIQSPSSEESIVEVDNKLLAELEAMGYAVEDAKVALAMSRNNITTAVDILVASGGHVASAEDPCNPSTSSNARSAPRRKLKKHKKDKRQKEREQALRRLNSSIQTEEDDYLDTSLVDEEEFLAQYKSLL